VKIYDAFQILVFFLRRRLLVWAVKRQFFLRTTFIKQGSQAETAKR